MATRHFAAGRGSNPLARTLARVTSRVVRQDIAISQFVADTIGSPSLVIPNGVPARPQAALEAPTVVMLQRLDAEKAPDVGIRAFALSGLAQQGWRLVVAGQGVLGPSLLELVDELDLVGSVDLVGHVAGTDRLLAGSSVLPGSGAPRALRSLGGRGHGPRTPCGGRRRAGPTSRRSARTGCSSRRATRRPRPPPWPALGRRPRARRSVGIALRHRQQDRFSLSRHVDRLERLYRELVDGVLQPV